MTNPNDQKYRDLQNEDDAKREKNTESSTTVTYNDTTTSDAGSKGDAGGDTSADPTDQQ